MLASGGTAVTEQVWDTPCSAFLTSDQNHVSGPSPFFENDTVSRPPSASCRTAFSPNDDYSSCCPAQRQDSTSKHDTNRGPGCPTCTRVCTNCEPTHPFHHSARAALCRTASHAWHGRASSRPWPLDLLKVCTAQACASPGSGIASVKICMRLQKLCPQEPEAHYNNFPMGSFPARQALQSASWEAPPSHTVHVKSRDHEHLLIISLAGQGTPTSMPSHRKQQQQRMRSPEQKRLLQQLQRYCQNPRQQQRQMPASL